MTYLSTATTLATGSDGDWSGIGLLFYAAGFLFFAANYLRYRNTDKRYRHESRTRTETSDLRARDDYVRSLQGLRSSTMRGANHRTVSGALNGTARLAESVPGGVRRLLRSGRHGSG
ncbi:hypothetical protein UQW22_06955 [Isoptericola halotolerans]|uniref:hypothetical protein n=1 Tax=Isoptericola halotolerans TaxID=300560 RepID=UPI00388FC3CC